LDKNSKQQVLTSLRHIQDQQSDVSFLLQTLGRLWLAGVQIDWSGFYTHEQRSRLPLPTYPFERQRYWIDAKSPSPSVNNKPTTLDNKQDIADWFYVPSWKRSLLLNSSSSQIEPTQENWLFFIDELGIGEKLINALINEGKNVIVAKQGEQFRELSDGVYTINPYSYKDYEALFQKLMLLGNVPRNIAYFLGLNKLKNCQSREYLEFNSLLFLTKSFGKLKISDRLNLWVISNNLQDVNGNEKLDPEKAVILGLCKVIPQEYLNITCRCIDVALTNCQETEGDYHSIIVDQLSNELRSLSSDLVVAYRDSYRWVQTFEPIRLEPVVEEKISLKEQGVYLFPAGLQSIEVVIAEYLAKTLQAKLIFIEDSDFPKKDDFSQWLGTHTQQDEVSYKINKLLALEKLGGKVLVIRLDTTNDEQIHQRFSLENLGQINGVIYSTGIKREHLFCSIPEINEIESKKIFDLQSDKMKILEQILQNRKLNFCIVFSSLSSTLGGLGLGLYSAANYFVDTFTKRQNRNNSLPWYLINWDKLQLNTNQEQKTDWQDQEAKLAITQTEAIEVFKRILSLEKATQVAVSAIDINTRDNHIFKSDFQEDTKYFNQLESSSCYSRPNLGNPYVVPRNGLEKQITEIWQEVLGIAEVGIYDNFYELGGDSLIATQLVSRLRAKFPVELALRNLLLEAMIPVKQAGMIEQLLLEKIEELSDKEVEYFLANLPQ
ncbi:MAG TPA: KR domain-containing protein, partial [Nostoc sp.]|uniref:KR prefix domain-containing protein n=1 Tax=Nostoc sp. TaxID=1180 RepID=UPI002D69A9C3